MSATIHTTATKAQKKEFLSLLKRTKKELDLSNGGLGMYLGASKDRVGRWLRGTSLPSSEQMETIIHLHDDVLRYEAQEYQSKADVRYSLISNPF